MADKCRQYCPLFASACDLTDPRCILRPREVARLRPDLVKPAVSIYEMTKSQRYYHRNREAVLERNREANNAASRRYRQNNRERRLQTERDWRKKNRDTINANRRAKRAELRTQQCTI